MIGVCDGVSEHDVEAGGWAGEAFEGEDLEGGFEIVAGEEDTVEGGGEFGQESGVGSAGEVDGGGGVEGEGDAGDGGVAEVRAVPVEGAGGIAAGGELGEGGGAFGGGGSDVIGVRRGGEIAKAWGSGGFRVGGRGEEIVVGRGGGIGWGVAAAVEATAGAEVVAEETFADGGEFEFDEEGSERVFVEGADDEVVEGDLERAV